MSDVIEPAEPDAAGATASGVGSAQLDEVTGALESLTAALEGNGDVDTLLQHVCRHVLEVIPGADMASVTLIRDGAAETAACTDERVFRLDADQYRAGEGPCLEAAATGQIVRVRVEQARQQWPEFTTSARQPGVGSYLSAPLTIDSRHTGSMNLYGEGNHGYADTDGALLELYLTAVTVALRATSRHLAAQELVGQLRMALTSRSTIDQAKGVIMAARGLSAEQAFEVLVEQSQQQQRKLRELAEELVGEVSDPARHLAGDASTEGPATAQE